MSQWQLRGIEAVSKIEAAILPAASHNLRAHFTAY